MNSSLFATAGLIAYLSGLSDIELNGLLELISRLAGQQKQLKAKGCKLSKNEKQAIKNTVPDEAAVWMSVVNGKLERGRLALLRELELTVREALTTRQRGTDEKKGQTENRAVDGSERVTGTESGDQRDPTTELTIQHSLEQNVRCTAIQETLEPLEAQEPLVKEATAEKRPCPTSLEDTKSTAEKTVVCEDQDTGGTRPRRVNGVSSYSNHE